MMVKLFRVKQLLAILNILYIGILCENNANLANNGFLKTFNETEPIMEKVLQGESYNGIITSEEEQYFDFIVKKKDEDGFPDIMIILDIDNLHGNADIYCSLYPNENYNEWVSTHKEGSDYVFISRNSTNYIYAMRSEEEAAFLCHIYGMSGQPTYYTLTMDVDYTSRTLIQKEQDIMKEIYDKCCEVKDSCMAWKESDIYVTHNLTTTDDINEEIINFDFCHMPFCICDDEGYLLKLSLRELQLSCELPYKELAKLSRIERLYLDGNYFTGDIQKISKHLSKIESLEVLNLQDLYLEGSLAPKSEKDENYVCSLLNNNMTTIYLDGNKDITGPIPECLLKDDTLTHLSISNCNLNTELPDVFKESKLEYLDISNSSLTGTFPPSLSKAKNLRSLSLAGNKLEGTLPDDMCDSDHYEFIIIQDNLLSGAIPEPLGSSKSLKYIYLFGNNFDKMPSGWINGMAKDAPIEEVYVDFNNLTGTFPLGLAQTNIHIIGFSNNSISGELPAVNDLFPSASEIYFGNNQISGNLPEEWSTLGMFKDSFFKMHAYHIMDLSYNNMSGKVSDVFLDDDIRSVLKVQKSIVLTGNNFDCIDGSLEDTAIVGIEECHHPNSDTYHNFYHYYDYNEEDDDSIIEEEEEGIKEKEDINEKTPIPVKNITTTSNDNDVIASQSAKNEFLTTTDSTDDESNEKNYIHIGFISGIAVLICVIIMLSVVIVLLVIRNKRIINNYIAKDMEFCAVNANNNDRVKLREGIDSSEI